MNDKEREAFVFEKAIDDPHKRLVASLKRKHYGECVEIIKDKAKVRHQEAFYGDICCAGKSGIDLESCAEAIKQAMEASDE